MPTLTKPRRASANGSPASSVTASAEVRLAEARKLIAATQRHTDKIKADETIVSLSTRGRHVLKAKADAFDELSELVGKR